MDDRPSRSPLPQSSAYGDDNDDLDNDLDADHPLALPYHPYTYVGDVRAVGVGDDSSRSSSPDRHIDIDVVVNYDDKEEDNNHLADL